MRSHKLTTVDLPSGEQITTRSALEARWALFFSDLGFKWEYEPKRFRLKPSGFYTPDFRVEGLGWVEIKPSLELFISESADRVKRFALQAPGVDVYAFCDGYVSFDCVALYRENGLFAPTFVKMCKLLKRDSEEVNRAIRMANQSKLNHMVHVGKVLKEVVEGLERDCLSPRLQSTTMDSVSN